MEDSEGTVRQIGAFSEGINNLTVSLWMGSLQEGLCFCGMGVNSWAVTRVKQCQWGPLDVLPGQRAQENQVAQEGTCPSWWGGLVACAGSPHTREGRGHSPHCPWLVGFQLGVRLHFLGGSPRPLEPADSSELVLQQGGWKPPSAEQSSGWQAVFTAQHRTSDCLQVWESLTLPSFPFQHMLKEDEMFKDFATRSPSTSITDEDSNVWQSPPGTDKGSFSCVQGHPCSTWQAADHGLYIALASVC